MSVTLSPRARQHMQAADRAMARVQDQLQAAGAVQPELREIVRRFIDQTADVGGWISAAADDGSVASATTYRRDIGRYLTDEM